MEKVLKYRAIDEFSDDFIYAPAFFVDSDNNQGYLAWGISNHHCVKKETVGQITPFKIGNTPIFEGDIIGDWTDCDGEMVQSRFEVFFCNKKGQWRIDISVNQDRSDTLSLYSELKKFHYSILGNIHEKNNKI